MNPLFNQLNTESQRPTAQGTNLDQIRNMMNMVRYSQDPRMAMESMIQSNPQFQNVMNLIRQNGGDPKTAFYNLARQKGVNPDDILKLLR